MIVLLLFELHFHFTKVLCNNAKMESTGPCIALSKIKSISWHLIIYFTSQTIMNVKEDIYNAF